MGLNEVVVRGQKNAGSPLLSCQLAKECLVDRMVDSETMNGERVPGNCLQNGLLVPDLTVGNKNDVAAALG